MIDQFLRDGWVRLDGAFSSEIAARCRQELWAASGCDPHEASTWSRPVVRLGELGAPPFREAASSPALTEAFDRLVGPGRWQPRVSLGTFPLRFPSSIDPGDCGWHVDASFGFEAEPDFLKWRVNVRSRGRALLMLFLFSDVGPDDAPTRLRSGSHLDLARRLAPFGDGGASLGELASTDFAESAHRPEALATGPAGTVFLCHPLLVHSAQPHRGRTPRFMAQPPLLPTVPLDPWRAGASPVERAIRDALGD